MKRLGTCRLLESYGAPGFEYGVKASGIIASPSGNATRAFGHSSRLDLDDWSLLRDPVLARY
jgi:hypothetical protein